MSWEDKMTENEHKLMKTYQRNFDKGARDNWTPSMTHWLQRMYELEEVIKKRADDD